MRFDACGFFFETKWFKKESNFQDDSFSSEDGYRGVSASFLGSDCSEFQLLAFLKSVIHTYLYNKIGTISEPLLMRPFSFAKKQRNGEVFLFFENTDTGEDVFLNYQEATMLGIAVDRALNLLNYRQN